MTTTDPTQRFASRVSDYVKARPAYPVQILELFHMLELLPPRDVADVGSGTGILTSMLLEHGYNVYAVEPNREMREACEQLLGSHENFHSVNARAESTTLPDASVDFVTAAQAFHWFDHSKTRSEFRRILKPGGLVFLIWNTRRNDASAFMKGYEQIIKTYSPDYDKVKHRNLTDDQFTEFFGTAGFQKLTIPNPYLYDWDRLGHGLLSASYAPQQHDSRHAPMMHDLKSLFDAHQQDGRVSYLLETNVYYGPLD